MELKMVKLVTGDVVLGKVQSENEDELIFDKPMILMLDPMQGGVGMIPYNAIYTQKEPEEASFAKKFIIEEMEIHSSFEEAYIKQTTGIETITPEIIQ